jgi:hypothetical protein
MSLVFLLLVVGAIVAASRFARRDRPNELDRPTERELLDAIDHWDEE